jgi:3'-phosphoadenosine 5'-phosphosulfate (PAPS) 3'-phosphatase
VVTSIAHFSQQVADVLSKLGNHRVVKCGGAGNKLTKVSTGQADLYVYPSRGMSFWDVCAGEVLVKGMGGQMTDMTLKRFMYFPHLDPKIRGVFAGRSLAHYQMVLKRFGPFIHTVQAML